MKTIAVLKAEEVPTRKLGVAKGDVYDIKARYKNVIKRIENSTAISERNRKLVFKFRDAIIAQGLSTLRIVFYLNRLYNIARWVDKEFEKVDREDLQMLLIRIQQMDYSPRTKRDHKIAIRKFYSWLDRDDRNHRANWIRTNLSSNHRNMLPEEILTKDDVQKLINTTSSLRDKDLIDVLWESGERVSELLTMRIKNVTFDKFGAVAIIHGKTGWRRVRLVSSVPRLSNWLEHHPYKNDPNAHLWVNVGTTNYGKPLAYDACRMRLRRIARKAEVKKRVNPQSFRIGRATNLAKNITEANMKAYFGWTPNSKMAAIYVHLSGRDTDNAILKLYGRLPKKEEAREQQLIPIMCPYCKNENAPESDHCLTCRRPLSIKAATDMENKEKEMMKMVTSEMVEALIQKKGR